MATKIWSLRVSPKKKDIWYVLHRIIFPTHRLIYYYILNLIISNSFTDNTI